MTNRTTTANPFRAVAEMFAALECAEAIHCYDLPMDNGGMDALQVEEVLTRHGFQPKRESWEQFRNRLRAEALSKARA